MTIRRSRSTGRNATESRQRSRDRRDAERRRLLLEFLEDRRMMAVGPRLAGIQPSDGALFGLDRVDVRSIAPRELVLHFDENQQIDSGTLSGIRVLASGGDGTFNDGNEVVVQPGYIGVGKAPAQSDVVIRFAETLTDDFYRVEIFARDNAALGVTALRNAVGDPFLPAQPNADRQTVDFELDLAPQVVAVVPQPVRRDALGGLIQSRNTIEVYFNHDSLFVRNDEVGNPQSDSAENPDFYQLIYTRDTVRNTDDVIVKPVSARYNPALNLVTLTFAQNLDQLVNPDTGAVIGPGTFRLRIGTNEAAPLPPLSLAPVMEVTTDFNTNDLAQVQFSAVRPGESDVALVVTKHDLGLSRAPLIHVVGSRVLIDMNSRPGSETRARDLVEALTAHPMARTLVVAHNLGDPNVDIATPVINYSPIALSGLGSSFNTATNLTDDTDLGAVLMVTGNGGTFVDGDFFQITDSTGLTRTFEFDSNLPAVLNDNAAIGIAFSSLLTPAEMAGLIRNAINQASFGVQAELAGNTLRLEGDLSVDLGDGVAGLAKSFQTQFDSGLLLVATAGGEAIQEGQTFVIEEDNGTVRTFEFDTGFVMTVAAGGGAAITDGTLFIVSDGVGTVTFEFEDPAVSPGTAGTNVPILFSAATTRQTLVNRIIAAIQNEMDLGNLSGFAPRDLGAGRIHLGGVAGSDLDVTGAPALSSTGTPGATAGAIPVPFVPSAAFTSNDVARSIATAINQAGTGLGALASGSRVRLNGERDVRLGAGLTALERTVQGRFDTGPVLRVTTSGAAIADGQAITIRDDRGQTRVFEFDRNGILSNPSATAIPMTGTETAAQIAQKLVVAINSTSASGYRVRSTALGDTVYLTNDRNVAIDPQLRAIAAVSQGLVISSAIDPLPYLLDLLGGSDDPGHRDIPEEVGGSAEQHINRAFGNDGRDATPGATTIFYNFRADYGVDPQGTPLLNAVTPEQKQRAREAFQLWGEYLGVQFLESEREGLTIATGDLRALPVNTANVLDYSSFDFRVRIDPKFAQGLLVLDSSVQWNDDFGGTWFRNAMVGVGSMLGLERANDLPRSTMMAFTSNFSFPNAPTPEPIFPGNFDILHGQHLYRPDGVDIDFYRFNIDLDAGRTGLLTLETFAERQPNSSLLDTVLSLYRENPDGTRELIARNDDYFGRDSYVEMALGGGTYYVAISAAGNTKFDPTIEDTGFGGRSQGTYELRMNFRSQVDDTNAIRDADGTPTILDGDGDGVPGGVYNFWFQTAPLDRVLEIAGNGSTFRDGQTVTLTSSQGVVRRFEFDSNNAIASGNVRVAFTAATTSAQMAQALSNAILGAGMGVTTSVAGSRLTLSGDRTVALSNGFVGLDIHGKTIFVDKNAGPNADGSLGRPFNNVARSGITNAFASTHPGDVVRMVGNGGADNDLSTLADNVPYEFGFSVLGGAVLTDGTEMAVPKGVTVMVEPGTVLKFRRSWAGVGSSSLLVDRSAGALQVLGTPTHNVYFTSWLDENVGRDSYPPTTTPSRGDWGGLIFRNDVDTAEARPNLEEEGIFLNYVNHARILYGGSGDVFIDSVQQIVNPIEIIQTRPTVTFNLIQYSADSAMSASPDSFDETNFHAPRYQSAGRFTSDYDRVGPEIRGNRLVNNSTNGLFVRIETPAGNVLQPLTVSGRFDDTDVVHVIAENLVIQGRSSTPYLDLERPAIDLITYSPRIGGILPAGTYNYKLTFVDKNGFEGRPSNATPNLTITGATGTIQLNQLPPATGDFTKRRIYRTSGTANGVYTLVAEIDASDTVFTDTGLSLNATLQRDPPNVAQVTLASQPRGSLAAGQYNYRIVFVDADGREGASSDPTAAITLTSLPARGGIMLSNLPSVTAGFVARRIYRSTVGGISPYTLVAEIDATSTTYVDDGYTIGGDLDVSSFGVIRARPSARLKLDPGIVAKFEGGRIEANYGAQFIAEGFDGREVIMTSRIDDQYGAGGTFDTNDDDNQLPAENQPRPGNWGGLFFGQLSSASIDHAVIAYAGGINRVEGTFTGFNAVEIHQADVRIAHSVIENNALGTGGQGPLDRFGRGYNRAAVIFARGAQPIILDNILRDNYDPTNTLAVNTIAAITINANSLTPELITDSGRETGPLDATVRYGDNRGPLIRGNRLDNNGLNGLVIRGEELTTQSIWDDTDIVHVVTNRYDRAPDVLNRNETWAFDEIIVPELHSLGGLRLQSSPSESLVVKFEGAGHVNNLTNINPTNGAGLTATGRRLGMTDRVGGTIAIVGQPGFPVVLTSIHDDTVGAGTRPNDKPQKDTNNNGIATIPRPNDWRSVRLDQFSNDRNVEIVLELEGPDAIAPGVNATTATAQTIGTLAPSEMAGDDNRRIGFEIHGFLNGPNDIDVYSFRGTAGTEIWIDVDRTTHALDTVIEILDADGVVLARSNDTLTELNEVEFVSPLLPDNLVNPLQKSPEPYYPTHASGLPKDRYSFNSRDAGMRLALPGVAGAENNYHVRIRSHNGLTSGVYQMQIRINERDEFPGSTVRYADIRYANTGVEVIGLPKHSPLLGEAQEDESTGSLVNNGSIVLDPDRPGDRPQNLGNILNSDRGALSIAGSLASAFDVDFYQFDVTYTAVSNTTTHHAAMVFDVDYADSLLRPNTILSVFDATGQLVLIGRDSNIAEDRPGPLAGADLSDLSRGSVGPGDPYIGPVEMLQGQYYVAVTSNRFEPTALSDPNVRLAPVNSVRRIAEDHIGSSGGGTALPPVVPVLFDPTFVGTGPNLWHVTNDRATDPGHGLTDSFDGSQRTGFGGASFYFGTGDGSVAPNTVPVGSAGQLTSNAFSLKGYSAQDLPVTYFSYFLDALPSDIFRLSVVNDAGVATVVASTNAVDLFNPNVVDLRGALLLDQWLQARVPLGQFAGQENLRLRFEFDTVDADPTLIEGVYVDDIIIGFAERGEMVSFAAADATFSFNASAPGNEILSGDYQLELRRASEFGTSLNTGLTRLALTKAIDTNDRLTEQTTLIAPAGNAVVEGQTFVISDGVNSVTFEFEDPEIGDGVAAGHVEIRFKTFNAGLGSFVADPNHVMARRIRDAINSQQVQTTLKVRAALADGTITGTTSTDHRINLFGAAIVELPASFRVLDTTNDGNALRDAILGAGVTPVGNANFTGSDLSAGFFQGGRTLIGMESGILLSTGDARSANGPNSSDAGTGRASQSGDADLDATFGVTTRDSSALEFQFQFDDGSVGGDFYLNFLFASEEYNERIGTTFSDAMAIYVDGVNVALVPGSTTPVSIDTVHSGRPFDPTGATGVNAALYRNNDPNDGGQYLSQFGYDGFTQVLRAELLGLAPGTHTVKIVISDVGDLGGDSAVFLEAGSLGNTPFVRPPEGIESVRHTGFGDKNHFRDQGQTLIHSNSIRDTLSYGVLATAGERDSDESAFTFSDVGRRGNPSPGPAINLSTANNVPAAGGFAPGVVIANNTISEFGVAGVHVGGDSRPWELTPFLDTASTVTTSGDSVCDGSRFTVTAFGTSVTFEWEDISGSAGPCGSAVTGGNGWTDGNIPIFYRRTGNVYTAGYTPVNLISENFPRSVGYNQREMAQAIVDAVESSILITNGTRHVIEANLVQSRLPQTSLITFPSTNLAALLEHVSSVTSVPGFATGLAGMRMSTVAHGPQPFARVINNTIYGSDGTQSFFPDAYAEPNDTLYNAIDTRQGRAQNPQSFVVNGVIGDGQNFRIDPSVDVDFYKFEMEVGDRVTIDLDATALGSPLDSVLRLFNSVGEELAFSDNDLAPGEVGGPGFADPYLDFTATVAGTYFVAVSGRGNETYSPVSLGNRTGPVSTGNYRMTLDVMHPRQAVITVRDPSTYADGTMFRVYQIPDLANQQVNFVTFEFDTGGGVAPGNIAIPVPGSGVGVRHPEMAVIIATAINNSPLTNVQSLPNGPFPNASPHQRVTAEAIGGINRAAQRIPEQFAGLDHLESGQNASVERFVVLRNISRIENVNSSLVFTPNPSANQNQQNLDNVFSTRERGILVSEQSTPTILNNILANTRLGIEQVAFQPGSPGAADNPPGLVGVVVEGASLYQHNAEGNSNIPRSSGDFQIQLTNTEPLFVNAANANFYPAPGAKSIDSAVDSVEERAAFRSIKTAAGITLSPLLAPDRDQSGQLRKDDPAVFTPSGVGANVFKDRGSLDRADFVGPAAVLINPLDNDITKRDRDAAVAVVQLGEGVYSHFSIQLVDGFEAADPFPGVGIDDLTVEGRPITVQEGDATLTLRGPAITIFENGRFLREGIDYTFRFDSTGNVVRLSPLAGIWPNDKVYVIHVNNRDRFVIDAREGTTLADGDTFTVTNAVGDTATFEYESGYIVRVAPTLALTVPIQGAATGGIVDGQRFSIDDGEQIVVFEFDRNNNVLPGSRPIPFTVNDTADQIAASIVTALNQAVTAGVLTGLAPKAVAGGVVHVGATRFHQVSVGSSALTRNVTQYLTGLLVPVEGGAVIQEGETFILRNAGTSVTFEFDTDGLVTIGNRRVPYAATDAQNEIADAIVQAISAAQAAGVNLGLNPFNAGDGLVQLGSGVNHSADVTQTVLQRTVFVGGVQDGETFYIQQGLNAPVRFEFDSDGAFTDADADNIPDNRLILFNNSDTHEDLAVRIAAALANSGTNVAPFHYGNGNIYVGGNISHTLDVGNSPGLSLLGRPGVSPSTTLTLPQSLGVRVPAAGGAALVDGGLFQISDGSRTVTFELDSDGQVATGHTPIAFSDTGTANAIASTIATEATAAGLGLLAVNLGGGLVNFNSAPNHTLDIGTSGLTGEGFISGLNDGDRFSIDSGSVVVTFEFEDAGLNNGVTPGNVSILFRNGDLVETIANSMAAAIRSAGLGLSNAANLGGGNVRLFDTPRHITRVVSGNLVRSGVAGAAVPIDYIPTMTDAQVADAIVRAINTGRLANTTATIRGGSTLFVDISDDQGRSVDFVNSMAAVTGVPNFFLSAVQDIPGNALKANQITNTTQFVILMPGVPLDFGDAPDPFSSAGRYPTVFDSDGARHVITPAGIRLGSRVDPDANGLPNAAADGDDADHVLNLSGTPLTSAALAPYTLQVPAAGGAAITDGTSFRIARFGFAPVVFEFDQNGIVAPASIPIPFTPLDTADTLARSIAAAVASSNVALPAVNLGGGQIFLGGRARHNIQTGSTSFRAEGAPPNRLIVPAGGVNVVFDNQTLEFFDGINRLLLEFDRDGSGSTVAGSTPVSVPPAATTQQIADLVRNAVTASGLSITLTDLGPNAQGEVVLHVTGLPSHTVDLAGSVIGFAARTPLAVNATGAGVSVRVPAIQRMQVPNTGGSGINDGDRFVISDGIHPPVTFEFDRVGGVAAGNRRVVFGLAQTADTVANSIVTAVQLAINEGVLTGLAPVNLGGGAVELNGSVFHKLDTSATSLLQAGPIAAGQTFLINDGVHSPLVFEFDSGAGVGAGHVPVSFQLSHSSDEIANSIVTAIKDQVALLALQGVDPVNVGSGLVDLRSLASVTISFAGSPQLTQTGMPGGVADGQTFTVDDGLVLRTFEFDRNNTVTPGNLAIAVSPTTTPDQLAAAIASALTGAGLQVNVAALPGGQVRLEGGDDDGIVFNGILTPGATTTITATVSAPGFLSAWIDFNQDGDWDDPGEQVLNNVAVIAGPNALTISVPALSPPPSTLPLGNTFARFRVSSAGNLLPTGLAVDGEVEDYRVRIVSNESPSIIPPGISDQIVNEDAPNTLINLALFFDDIDLNNGNGDALAFSVVGNDRLDLVNATIGFDGHTLILDYLDDANGTANIRVRATDLGGLFVEQTFLVQVIPINDRPVAIPSVHALDEDTFLDLTLQADDGDPERVQTLTFNVEVGPANGQILNFNPATGSFRYIPNVNFNGPDTVVFSVTDDNTAGGPPLTSLLATITLNVAPVNDAPIGTPQAVTTAEDTDRALVVTGSDGDPELTQALTFALAQTPANGTIVSFDGATGAVVYRPNPNFVGVDTFTFLVTDDDTAGGAALTSIPATVTVTVTPVNDPPVVSDLALNIVEDTAVAITLPGDDGDPEVVQSLTYRIVSAPLHGVLSNFDVAAGTVVYTPNSGYNGTDSFTFQIEKDDETAGEPRDLPSGIATIAINISAVNDPPIALGQTVTTPEDSQINITLTGDDGDPELVQVLTFSIASQPANGTLIGFNQATGQVIYRPNANFNGVDSFTFTVRDNGTPSLVSGPGTVTVTVDPVNDPPVGAPATLSLNEDTPTTFTLTGHDGDPERTQTLTFAIVAQPRGTITNFNPLTGEFTYQPPLDFNGTDSLSFTVTDDATAGGAALTSAPAVVTFNVLPVNDAPQFTRGANQSVNEDAGPQSILGWASGIRPGPLSATDEVGQIVTFLVQNTNNSLFSAQPIVTSNGTLQFTPALDRNGIAVVTVQAVDNGPANAPNVNVSAPETFTITVNAVNDPPEFVRGPNRNLSEDAGPQVIPNWATGIAPGPATAVDEVTQVVSFAVTNNNNQLFSEQPSVSSDGTLSFTPAPDANGIAVVTVRAQDSGPSAVPNQNQSSPQSFTIVINAINDAPEFTSGADPRVLEDAGLVRIANWATGIRPGPVTAADEVGQQLTFLTNVVATTGTLAFVTPPAVDAATGELTFRAAADSFGTATLTLALRDNGFSVPPHSNTSATQTVVITVDAVNDPPQFTIGPEQTVNEDSGPQTVVNWITDIRSGPATAVDENAQTVTFQVTTSNPNLFSTPPAVSVDGLLTYTPAPDANGVATVVVTAIDSGPGDAPNVNSMSRTTTIRVTPVNDAPTFTRGPNVVLQEDAGPQVLPGWASGIRPGPATALDEAAQTLTFNVTVVTANGPISFSAPPAIDPLSGNLTFTTAQDANGTAVVRVTLSDNGPSTAPNVNTSPAQSFTISVTPVNDPPFVANPISDFTVSEDSPNVSLELFPQVFNDPDVATNADVLTFAVSANSNPSLVNASLNGTRLNLSFLPNQNGLARIVIQARDRQGATAENAFTVTVAPVNDPPVAQNDFVATGRNQPITINVLANDSDIDGTINVNSLVIVASPSRGAAVINPGGTITYTPPSNFLGEVSFRYTVQDNDGATSQEAVVTVKVNDPPVARNDSVSITQGTTIAIDVLANDSDSDGQLDRTSVVITVPPTRGNASVNPVSGIVTFSPFANATGNDSFRYRVKDDNGFFSNEAIVSIAIARSFAWQNPTNRLDVNADGIVSPIDALLIVNYLNTNGSGELPVPGPGFAPPPYLDASGDGFVAPNDALDVINQINQVGGEAEARSAWIAPDYGTTDVILLPDHSLMQATPVRSRQPNSSHSQGGAAAGLASLPDEHNLLVGNRFNNYGGDLAVLSPAENPWSADDWDALVQELAEHSSGSFDQDANDSALRDLFG